MEYCPYGNVREFLRNSRSLYNVQEESLIADLSRVIGPKNLIYFAWQIAKGMTFLISRKVKEKYNVQVFFIMQLDKNIIEISIMICVHEDSVSSPFIWQIQ